MKYVKGPCAAFVAAALLAALVVAGSASATELTCGTVDHTRCPKNSEIHAVSEGKVVIDTPSGNVECEMTIQALVENAGSSTETATATITVGGLVFVNCGGDTVTPLATGILEFHTDTVNNDGNGMITSIGMRITVIHLGVHCIYETNSTTFGTVTGSTNTHGKATVDMKGTLPRVGGTGGAFCGSSAPLTGSLTITTPQTFVVN
ncbi:MAG: hypothetical protein ACTHK6_07735 [Solirubrobacterales bacterium]